LKIVQGRAGNTLEAVVISNDFLIRTQLAQKLRERIDKLEYLELKSFCIPKEMISKLKTLPTEWEKIFVSYISDKGLISRICRQLKKLNS
jgi:hypothetical protein